MSRCDKPGQIYPKYWRNGRMGFDGYPWGAWSPVIPTLYWQAISPEQQIHDLYCYVENLLSYSNAQTGWITDNHDKLDELEALFNEWVAHGFDEQYKDLVIKWIDDHMQFIFEHCVKQIFPALTEDGRFCVYIPDGWSDITFNVPVLEGFDYGRIMLVYDADGVGVIDNTGRYDDTDREEVARLRADVNALEMDMTRVNHTLYDPMSEGGEG